MEGMILNRFFSIYTNVNSIIHKQWRILCRVHIITIIFLLGSNTLTTIAVTTLQTEINVLGVENIYYSLLAEICKRHFD